MESRHVQRAVRRSGVLLLRHVLCPVRGVFAAKVTDGSSVARAVHVLQRRQLRLGTLWRAIKPRNVLVLRGVLLLS